MKRLLHDYKIRLIDLYNISVTVYAYSLFHQVHRRVSKRKICKVNMCAIESALHAQSGITMIVARYTRWLHAEVDLADTRSRCIDDRSSNESA